MLFFFYSLITWMSKYLQENMNNQFKSNFFLLRILNNYEEGRILLSIIINKKTICDDNSCNRSIYMFSFSLIHQKI